MTPRFIFSRVGLLGGGGGGGRWRLKVDGVLHCCPILDFRIHLLFYHKFDYWVLGVAGGGQRWLGVVGHPWLSITWSLSHRISLVISRKIF